MEMAWANMLLCKYVDLNMNPQRPLRKLGPVTHVCNPESRKDRGLVRGIGVEIGWTSILAEMSGSGFSERPYLRKKI